MTLKSFALGLFLYIPAICFWIAIVAIAWEEITFSRNMKKALKRARELSGRIE